MQVTLKGQRITHKQTLAIRQKLPPDSILLVFKPLTSVKGMVENCQLITHKHQYAYCSYSSPYISCSIDINNLLNC